MATASSDNGSLTQTTAMNRSQDAVFHTVELLEQILLQASWTDVYRCQRVNHHFRNVILKSTLLRQRAWTLPRDYQSGLKELTYICVNQYIVRSRDYTPLPRNILPMFLQSCKGHEDPVSRKGKWVEYLLILPRPFNPEASWRKMYLTQPPIAEVHVRLEWGMTPPGGLRHNIYWQISADVRDPHGLTLGNLVDQVMIKEARRSTVLCSTCKLWHPEKDCGSLATAETDLQEYEEKYGRQGFAALSSRCTVEFPLNAGMQAVRI